MSSCDLCGKPATTKARIEGAIMNACSACATYGKELTTPKPAGKVAVPNALRTQHASFGSRHQHHSLREEEGEFVLAGDFGQRLRAARQRMKLTEEEVALKLQISKNDILHYEGGKRQPSETMTKKLEKFYGTSLRITL